VGKPTAPGAISTAVCAADPSPSPNATHMANCLRRLRESRFSPSGRGTAVPGRRRASSRPTPVCVSGDNPRPFPRPAVDCPLRRLCGSGTRSSRAAALHRRDQVDQMDAPACGFAQTQQYACAEPRHPRDDRIPGERSSRWPRVGDALRRTRSSDRLRGGRLLGDKGESHGSEPVGGSSPRNREPARTVCFGSNRGSRGSAVAVWLMPAPAPHELLEFFEFLRPEIPAILARWKEQLGSMPPRS
jgi:hypothetical protein